jgi:arylformamidase
MTTHVNESNEAAYNNRQRVPQFADILADWQRRSEATRARTPGARDVAYGPDPRQAFDLFEPARGGATAPLVVFIHGGYWRSLDRRSFSFAAEGLLAHGVAVAMPSYRLCPTVKVADIIADMRTFLPALYRATGRRAAITGHSAGGHLAAALLATDWADVGDVPADLARYGYAISGVFDLAPLVSTSINDALRETVDTTPAVSPMLWPLPRKDRWLTAAVGGDESSEFVRQSVDMAATWSAGGVAAEAVIVPRTNHFTVLEDLARADSAMVERISDLARRATLGQAT